MKESKFYDYVLKTITAVIEVNLNQKLKLIKKREIIMKILKI